MRHPAGSDGTSFRGPFSFSEADSGISTPGLLHDGDGQGDVLCPGAVADLAAAPLSGQFYQVQLNVH
jgi:hypothetical protein